MFYISQLFETNKLLPIIEQYGVGLEVISFSIGTVLDELSDSISYYEEDFKRFKQPLPMIFHGPFLDLAPGSCDTKIVAITKKRFEYAYEAGKAFGVNHFVFHAGYVPKTYPKQYWLQNVEKFWQDFIKDKIEDNFFYIENVLEKEPTLIKELIDTINHPHFLACLDIGHVHAHTEKEIEYWIEVLGERIGHVHIHNNSGIEDTHSGIQQGSICIEQILTYLQKIAPNATYTLEIGEEDQLVQSLEWLKSKKILKNGC